MAQQDRGRRDRRRNVRGHEMAAREKIGKCGKTNRGQAETLLFKSRKTNVS